MKLLHDLSHKCGVTCPSYPKTLIWPSTSAFVSWNLKEISIKDELSLRPREKKILYFRRR